MHLAKAEGMIHRLYAQKMKWNDCVVAGVVTHALLHCDYICVVYS